MRLSMKDHAAAAEYLKTRARPLEKTLYEYQFERAGAEPALCALSASQNADGGFGNALEPDIRLSDSSVIATTQAFQHFRALGLSADHPMVTAAARWLESQFLESEMRWRIMPANVDDAPHAPWWVVGGDLWNSRVNPTAEILGYMYEYPAHFNAARRDELTRQLSQWLDSQGSMIEMHDLLCFVALVENPAVPEAVTFKFLQKLKSVVDSTVERSPDKWAEYSIPPLGVVSSPDSPFAALFKNELPRNFEFLLGGRSEDGAWHPNWQWGDAKSWAQVDRDWAGVLTLANLKKLRAFNLIAGVKQ